MRNFMNKKVKLFGREFSVFVVAIIAVMGIATASYLTYFGVITAEPTVNQGLYLDSQPWNHPIVENLDAVLKLFMVGVIDFGLKSYQDKNQIKKL